MLRSIGARMVVCRGSGVLTDRLGVCRVGMWRCELCGFGVRGELSCVGDGGTVGGVMGVFKAWSSE